MSKWQAFAGVDSFFKSVSTMSDGYISIVFIVSVTRLYYLLLIVFEVIDGILNFFVLWVYQI
jgi:hypothetical protein